MGALWEKLRVRDKGLGVRDEGIREVLIAKY
jgi:hypothetical protein